MTVNSDDSVVWSDIFLSARVALARLATGRRRLASAGRAASRDAPLIKREQIAAVMQGVGETLAAANRGNGGDVHLHMENNVFHGVPDPQYVTSIMNQAVTQLRNSSRNLGV